MCLYGGYDKIMKLIKIREDDRQNYEEIDSVYFEGLPILKSKFVN